MAATDNLGPKFLGIFVSLSTIAAVLVFLRLWIRTRFVHKVGLDDWVVLTSLILVFGSIGCMGVAVHYGLGKHYDTLTPYQARMALKMLWVGFQITPSAEATAKISITIMLMRITTSKRWKYFFYALIVLIIFITVASLYSIMLSCHPVQMLWDPSVPGTCDVLERTVDIYLQGVIAAGYDVILATSPILLLWNVQISPRSKWLLCGLLGLGFFTSGAGIARTVYTPDSTNTTDPTWAIMNFVIWKCVELPLSIIVGCLPALRPLYDKVKLHSIKDSRRLQNGPYQVHPFNGDTIRMTTSIHIGSSGTSADQNSFNPTGWEVENRV